MQLATSSTPHNEWTQDMRRKKMKDFWEFCTLFYEPELNRQENKLNLAKVRKFKNKNQKIERNFYFLTICPPEHVELKESLKCIKSLIKWTCWTDVIAVAEQRSSTKEFYGHHYHILAKKKQKVCPQQCKAKNITNCKEMEHRHPDYRPEICKR